MADNKDYPKIKRRVWEIQSQCYHNGKAIWTPEIVEKVIEKLSAEKLSDGKPVLKRWAWCNHDKDKVREENIEQLRFSDPLKEYNIGDDRPAHIHLALEFANAVYNTRLEKVTGLDIHFIRKPEAKYMQFMAIATYLSHCKQAEQDKGKHLYPVEEIHCNFNYAEEVDKYLARTRNMLQSNPRNLANSYINKIESGDLRFEDAKRKIRESAEGFAFFLRYEKELRAARAEYIRRHYEMKPRANYYIFGESGTGKSTLSKYIARALFPTFEEYECYYTVGATGVRYDDFDHQPTIIFEDIRGETLCDEYGSEGILNLMELNPKKRSYSIKFGKVTLTHQVNIFTTPDRFEVFAEQLMGKEYKDDEIGEHIEQVYRRFPLYIEVRRDEILVYGNDRIYKDAKKSEFNLYYRIENTNIGKLNRLYGGDALDKIFATITAPIVELHNQFMDKMSIAEKVTDEEFVPKIIKVVDFTQGAEDNSVDMYHAFCMDMLDSMRLPNGELGPYISMPEWTLGDELTGEYGGLYCPMTYEQWKEIGKPEKYSSSIYDGLYGSDAHRAKDSQMIANAWRQAMETSSDTNDEETDEEFYEEEYRTKKYVERITTATAKLMGACDEQELTLWVHEILNDDSDGRILSEGSEAYKHLMDCWGKVRSFYIENGLAEDEIDWYRLYQKANCVE